MKKIKRISKVLSFIGLSSFIILIIWANWTPLSAGEKAIPVDFKQYQLTSIQDSSKIEKIQNVIKSLKGVRAFAYNKTSNILSVGYVPDQLSCEKIENTLVGKVGVTLVSKTVDKQAKKCPMTATRNAFSSLRKTLNFR